MRDPEFRGELISFKPLWRQQQEIKHTGSASGSETYTIHAQLDKTTTLSLNLVRPADAPGFKLGKGEEGGYSRFGKNMGDDGFVIQ